MSDEIPEDVSCPVIPPPAAPVKKFNGAFLVGAGILLSRIAGLVREIVFAHYFGNSDAADVFKAALRIPNFLQNLFGEGALSASFIPIYAGLRARGENENAQRVAGCIAALLGLAVSILVSLGVVFTPYLVDLITPGFSGEKREYVIVLVRIFFPGAGLLVMSAWCLGILNSHRRFFVSYTAPVIWNVTIILALVLFGGRSSQYQLAVIASWASVLGSLQQFLVQLPTALKLVEKLRLALDLSFSPVRKVLHNFTPVVIGRGVVQISAYVDSMLASFLPTGGLAALVYAQTVYLLPVSLFGISVSAAELPEMSSATGTTEEISASVRSKLAAGLRKIAFFVIPTVVVFLAFGDLILGTLYQSGQFTKKDTLYVWITLAGLTPGLLAATLARLYASGFYALHDTRTPLRFALIRVVLAATFGYLAALHLPQLLGIDASWGVVGITGASACGAWVEYLLLRNRLREIVGDARLERDLLFRLWGGAGAALVFAFSVKVLCAGLPSVVAAIAVLGSFGLAYLGSTSWCNVPESRTAVRTLCRLGR